MEQEVVALGHDVQVVDPDVRGYVYSLVTAVSATSPDRRSRRVEDWLTTLILARRFQWRRRR
jgi:hypothetical protein